MWPEDPFDLLARVVALHATRLLNKRDEDSVGFEEEKKLAPAEWSFCSAKDLDGDDRWATTRLDWRRPSPNSGALTKPCIRFATSTIKRGAGTSSPRPIGPTPITRTTCPIPAARPSPRRPPWAVLGSVLDKDSSASVQIVAKLLKGEIPGLPRLGYPIVDVRDLADLEIRAMTAPRAAGQRYIGSGPFISLSEIANVLKERLGDQAKKVPTRELPDWVVRFVGLFDSEVRGQLFELGKVRRPPSAKAEKDLGWPSRPLEDTIVDTATSLEAVGALS